MQTFPDGAAPQALVIGHIKRRHAGSTNTPRWALYRAASPTHPERLSNTFAADLSRDGVAVLLAEGGFTLQADNTVVLGCDPVSQDTVVGLAEQGVYIAEKTLEGREERESEAWLFTMLGGRQFNLIPGDRNEVSRVLALAGMILRDDNAIVYRSAAAASLALDPAKIAAAQASHDAVKATFGRAAA